jgi:TolA-binding protein
MTRYLVYIFSLCLAGAASASIPKQKANGFPEGEKLVYSKFLNSFRKADLQDMEKQKKLLEQNYPASIHLDNAYYLIGALEYQQDHLGEALRAFDHVVNQFPQSARRSAALFGMGMTYKKLNLSHQAQAVFKRVINLYPGSPESQRAWLESRMADNEKSNSSKTK